LALMVAGLQSKTIAEKLGTGEKNH
jgi:hypothetical protein